MFAFDLVPLPLGTVRRVAAIPLLGCATYLPPPRPESTELAFVLANHTWLARTGRSYEVFVAGSWAPLGRPARWLVPHPEA